MQETPEIFPCWTEVWWALRCLTPEHLTHANSTFSSSSQKPSLNSYPPWRDFHVLLKPTFRLSKRPNQPNPTVALSPGCMLESPRELFLGKKKKRWKNTYAQATGAPWGKALHTESRPCVSLVLIDWTASSPENSNKPQAGYGTIFAFFCEVRVMCVCHPDLGNRRIQIPKKINSSHVNIPREEQAVLLVISCFQLRSLQPDSFACLWGLSLVNGTLSIIYLNKGEPEVSSKHLPDELEPNSGPLEFPSLHDLGFVDPISLGKKEKKKR